MGGRLSSFGRGVYDSKRREFLGRDGAGWGRNQTNIQQASFDFSSS